MFETKVKEYISLIKSYLQIQLCEEKVIGLGMGNGLKPYKNESPTTKLVEVQLSPNQAQKFNKMANMSL